MKTFVFNLQQRLRIIDFYLRWHWGCAAEKAKLRRLFALIGYGSNCTCCTNVRVAILFFALGALCNHLITAYSLGI